jgi:glycosyltransferase involved in cell wall biosynthesis
MTKVLHAITSLDSGGAQTMLLRLLEEETRGAKFEPIVLGLMNLDAARVGSVAPQLAALRVPIATLEMARRRPTLVDIWRLYRTVRAAAPDLIHGWMYHGSLAATIGSRSLPYRPPVIWNIRHSVHDLALEKRLTRAIIRVCARLSRLPRAIVYNARVSAAQHQALGFAAGRAVVIPNGFDTARFRPRPDAKARLCRELGIEPALTLIGMIARNHPMKDPGNLLRAVALLQARGGAAVHLVIVATASITPMPSLARWCASSAWAHGLRCSANARTYPRLSPASTSRCCHPRGAKASPTCWARRWRAACRASRPTWAIAPGWSVRTA